MEIGDPTRQARVADADLRLDAAGPVDDADEPTRRSGRVVDRARDGIVRRSCPLAEEPRHEPDDVLATKVARNDQGRPAGVERSPIGSANDVAIEPRNALPRPCRGPVVGGTGGIDRPDEALVGPSSGIGLRLEQVVEALIAQALDLTLWEGRVEQDVGEELQRRCKPARRHIDADARRVPSGLRMERGAQSFRRLGEGDRVVALRPLGQGASRKHG